MDHLVRKLLHRFYATGTFEDLLNYVSLAVRIGPLRDEVRGTLLQAVATQDWGQIYDLAETSRLADPYWLPVMIYMYMLPDGTPVQRGGVSRPIDSIRSHNLIHRIAEAGGLDFVITQIRVIDPDSIEYDTKSTEVSQAINAILELPIQYLSKPETVESLRTFIRNSGSVSHLNSAMHPMQIIGTRDEDIPLLTQLSLHPRETWTPVNVIAAIIVIGGRQAIQALQHILQMSSQSSTVHYSAIYLVLAIIIYGDANDRNQARVILDQALHEWQDASRQPSWDAQQGIREALRLLSATGVPHYRVSNIRSNIAARQRFWQGLADWRTPPPEPHEEDEGENL